MWNILWSLCALPRSHDNAAATDSKTDDAKKRAEQSNKRSLLTLMFEDFILFYESGGFLLASNASHITMFWLDTWIQWSFKQYRPSSKLHCRMVPNDLGAKTCMASSEGQITFGIDLKLKNNPGYQVTSGWDTSKHAKLAFLFITEMACWL